MSDLAKYSMTRRVARSLCDSCASCFLVYANDLWYILLNLVLILVPFRAYFNDIYVTLKGKIVPVPHYVLLWSLAGNYRDRRPNVKLICRVYACLLHLAVDSKLAVSSDAAAGVH